jgi:hypothetical protein
MYVAISRNGYFIAVSNSFDGAVEAIERRFAHPVGVKFERHDPNGFTYEVFHWVDMEKIVLGQVQFVEVV